MRIHLNGLVATLLVLSAVSRGAERCDLVARRCLDFADKTSASVTMPASTTRIPTDGMILCNIPGSTPRPTDIVYIVDQSTSMKPTAIHVSGKDTTGWYGCNGDARRFTCTGSVAFHDAMVCQIPSSTAISTILSADCKEAGDTYSARAAAVYASIRSQAASAPGTYAATINFNRGVSATQASMTRLDAAGVDRLLTTVPLNTGSYTNYEAPLEWARILLNGGSNLARGTMIPASSSAGKAVILISDGHPNDGDWQNALGAVDTVTMAASMFPGAANAAAYEGKWTGSSPSVPPVYGIYLGNDASSATVLRTISERTGGSFHLIPPSQPDSLSRVIEGILADLITPAVPTTFSVTNVSNGTTSNALEHTLDQKLGGYRVVLDSLLPLESGSNRLVLRTKATFEGVSVTLLDTIVVNVSGTGTAAQDARGMGDALASRCFPATTLSVSPDASGLPYAEASRSDANLATTLATVPGNYGSLPVSFTTKGHADREGISIVVPPTAIDTASGRFTGMVAWSALLGGAAAPGDGAVQSGYGWDTAIARFQMPRDKRDTASARIALHRSTTPRIDMTRSVIGPSGSIVVTVVDSSVSASTVVVRLRGGTGTDSLSLQLTAGAKHVFAAEFRFAQDAKADPGNPILELPRADGADQTVVGRYASSEGNISATTVVVSDVEPEGARIVDSDADGRADRVVVVLRKPLKYADSIEFSWPETSGGLRSRVLPLGAGRVSADGLLLTFELDPFAFGATSCPAAGCQGLGSVWSSRSSTSRIAFAIADGVHPVPTKARYRYASQPSGLDTLIVDFSEKMDVRPGTGAWVSVGEPTRDSLGVGVAPLEPAKLDQEARTAYFLVDSTFVGVRGDLLRITIAGTGVLADTSGNAPGRLAYWTKLDWGAPRPVLALQVPHPVVNLEAFEFPPAEAAVARWVRATEEAPWTSVDGRRSEDISRYSGLVVRLNRIPHTLKLYIYDNLGVDVLNIEFDDFAGLVESGALQRTRRGDYELWLAWNGKDAQGRKVATGVYAVRALVRIKDDEFGHLVLHGIRKVGIHRSMPQ